MFKAEWDTFKCVPFKAEWGRTGKGTHQRVGKLWVVELPLPGVLPPPEIFRAVRRQVLQAERLFQLVRQREPGQGHVRRHRLVFPEALRRGACRRSVSTAFDARRSQLHSLVHPTTADTHPQTRQPVTAGAAHGVASSSAHVCPLLSPVGVGIRQRSPWQGCGG